MSDTGIGAHNGRSAVEREQIILNDLAKFWNDNPELVRSLQEQKRNAVLMEEYAAAQENIKPEAADKPKEPPTEKDIFSRELRGWPLREKINNSYHYIRQELKDLDSSIEHRTAANNQKLMFSSIQEEKDYRADILSDQIRTWRSILPKLIKRFSKCLTIEK